jgi:hypothetical protein
MRRILSCSVLFVLCSALLVWGQTASIQGTIVDKGGAVVEGAEITVHNLATNATRTVVSNNAGSFSVTNLAVGNYEIVAKKESFKIFRIGSTQLTVDQALTLNITLEPGAVAEEVEVHADAVPAVDLETAQVSNIVDAQKMQNLPLILRDPYQLVLLTPGAIQSNTGLGGFSVNGTSERNNNFLLDGVDNNDTSVPGIAGGLVSLNPDATEEFRVITNNFMPEFGRNDGAIVDVVTKSGTNTLHGNAYWFGRYNALGARDYFNHLNSDGSVQPQNPYVRNTFGFSVGGPIIKDKTFFFVNNDFQRFRTTLTNLAIVPTAAFKSGVFTYNGFPIDLTDPSSPNNVNGFAFPDPTTSQILALYPDPNGPAVDDMRGEYFFPSRSATDSWNLTTKIDHRLTDYQSLSARYAYNTLKDPNPFHDDFLPGIGATSTRARTQNLGLSLTSTLRSTLVNEAKFGWDRTDLPFACGSAELFDSMGTLDKFGRGRDYNLPNISGFGCFTLGDSNGQSRRTGTWTVADNLSWVKGSHTMKFGGEHRRIYENGFNNFGSRDMLTFNGFTNFGWPFVNVDPGNPCDPGNPDYSTNGCGSAVLQNMSSMLFGITDIESQSQFFDKSETRVADDFRKFRQKEYAFFVQDSWRLRPNLTVSLGLRYQFNGVPWETDGNLSNLYVPANGVAPFTFELAGPDASRLLYNNDFSNIEPRVGFAWDPFSSGKTSVRGGFGIFHDRIFGNLFGNARGNPPFLQSYTNYPIFSFEVPSSLPPPIDMTTSTVVQQGAFINPVLFDPNLRMPYIEGWNLGVQRELLQNLTVDVNYIGRRGVHLLRDVDGNPPDPVLVQQLIDAGVPESFLQFAALYVGAEFFGFPFDAVHNNAFINTTNFAAPGAFLNRSIGNSIYNGLQVNVTRRRSHGFEIHGAYTFAHAIDDVADALQPAFGNRSLPRNSYNLRNERGSSDFDIRHRLVLDYTWELPVGRGRAYLNSGVLGKAFEGWQISGITTLQAGHPYDVFYNVDVEHTGLSGRGTLMGSTALPAGHDRTQTGPPLSAFCVDLCTPPFGVPGNVGRNHFTGPSFHNWDMALGKNTTVTERMKMEFRLELYNVFNRVQFGQPDNLLQDTGTFGFSTSTLSQNDGTTTARQVQFGLKLKF